MDEEPQAPSVTEKQDQSLETESEHIQPEMHHDITANGSEDRGATSLAVTNIASVGSVIKSEPTTLSDEEDDLLTVTFDSVAQYTVKSESDANSVEDMGSGEADEQEHCEPLSTLCQPSGSGQKPDARSAGRKTTAVASRRKPKGKKSLVCDICNKYYSNAYTLKIHKKIHSDMKPFVCDVCNRSFSSASYLNSHKMNHAGEKPFTCDYCDKSFSCATNLNAHKVSHTGSKRFSCDQCGKAFTYASGLSLHKKTHTGLSFIVCDVCDKTFSQASHLKRHMVIHTGKKPHACDVCGKDFARIDNLRAHMTTHKEW